MKVCVYGLGAVGGHMAVRLAQGGASVSAVARGDTLRALRSGPLVLDAGDMTLAANLTASDDPAALGAQDVVVVAVKFDALADVLARIGPLMGPETIAVFAMNGLPWWFGEGLPGDLAKRIADHIDPAGMLRRALPAGRWIACVVTSGNRVAAPGRVVNMTPGGNSLSLGGPTARTPAALHRFAECAAAGGYRVEVTERVRERIWRKLLINAALSSVSTIADRDSRQTCSDPATRAVVMAAMDEILALGRAVGFDVAADPLAMTDPATAAPHITSFLQDRRAGRPLEIHSGILAVREIARTLAVPCPHLVTLAALLAAVSPVPAAATAAPAATLATH